MWHRRLWTRWWVSSISNFPFVQIMTAERAVSACRHVGRGNCDGGATSARQQVSSLSPVATPRPTAPGLPAALYQRPQQANGIRFLTAEIPLRTFTPRPTEINRLFNTNSTALSPHWQTDEYFRFSFFRLTLVFGKSLKRSVSYDVSMSSVLYLHITPSLF